MDPHLASSLLALSYNVSAPISLACNLRVDAYVDLMWQHLGVVDLGADHKFIVPTRETTNSAGLVLQG
jgi:hypothetical protein